MTDNINELVKLVCPACGKPLTSEEYKHVVQKLEITIKKEYEKELEVERISIKEECEQIHNQRLHEELRKQSKMHQYEISGFTHMIKEKDETIKEKDETIKEKDIQIERAKKECDEMNIKLTTKQSELVGEGGERTLLKILEEVFPQDVIERTKRGTEDGDIIHSIRTPDGILETKIVYDNKSSSAITTKDCKKMQIYKNLHKTRYGFIIFLNPPKEIKNGYIGQKEGITLVHISIIAEVVKIVREEIIRISNYAKTKDEKDTKEEKLYNFITSDEFWGLIEENLYEYKQMKDELEKEKRNHQKIWEEREKNLEKLKDNMDFVIQKVKRITESNLMMIQQ